MGTVGMRRLVGTIMVLSAACGVAGADEPCEPVEMTFEAKVDKTEQKYVVMLPEGFDPREPRDVLIVLHGHGSDRWQYVREDRGECRGARDVAARHGLIFASPDYRAPASWMGPKAEADTVQLVATLRRKYKVRRVFLAGASMGGASALVFAALHPKLVDGVVSQNGTANMMEYENFQPAIAASYGGDKTERPEEYLRRSPELVPKRFTMPVAFCVGGKDTSVPPDSVRRLAARLKKLGKKDVLLIDRPDGGHATGYEDTVKALEFVLRAARVGKRKPSAAPDAPEHEPAPSADSPKSAPARPAESANPTPPPPQDKAEGSQEPEDDTPPPEIDGP